MLIPGLAKAREALKRELGGMCLEELRLLELSYITKVPLFRASTFKNAHEQNSVNPCGHSEAGWTPPDWHRNDFLHDWRWR